MINIKLEKLRDGFEKYHIKGMPVNAVIHKISEADLDGLAHNHPWGFTSIVLFGGYVEKVYYPQNYSIGGEYTGEFFDAVQCRKQGDMFTVKSGHIHEIVSLPQKVCYTLILPQNEDVEWGFWKFSGSIPDRNCVIEYRKHDEKDFKRIV